MHTSGHEWKPGNNSCALVCIRGLLLFACCLAVHAEEAPLRLAIAGLAHGHVSGFLNSAMRRSDVQLVGVFDPDPALGQKYAHRQPNGFAANLLYTDLGKMLDTVKPDAVATFTGTFDHAMVVEACVQRHIPVMMEK